MKWIGISGSRLLTTKEVRDDVYREVRQTLARGDGIVTGGAIGVDQFATEEAVLNETFGNKIKICLPTTFDIFAKHYRKRADEGVITQDEAENLIALLEKVKEANPEAIIESTTYVVCDKESYYARNGTIVDLSDEVYAFQVNGSGGTQDTIDQAILQGKEVKHFVYKIA